MLGKRKKYSGYVLFDVLTGSVILAAAIAVAAVVNQRGQKQAEDAWHGQQALAIAEDVATRIRLNSNQSTSFGNAYTDQSLWSGLSSGCLNKCNAREQMRRDGSETAQMVARLLPQGGVRVARCALHLCIFVWWLGDEPTSSLRCKKNCIRLAIIP